MSPAIFETFKALLTGGMAALVFVAGQGVLRFIIEPAAELRKCIGEVGYLLVFWADVFHNVTSVPDELAREARREARRLAALLESRAQSVPLHGFWAMLGWLPARRSIHAARKSLIFLSNNSRTDMSGEETYVDRAYCTLRTELNLPEYNPPRQP